jgi:hypothetical protein
VIGIPKLDRRHLELLHRHAQIIDAVEERMVGRQIGPAMVRRALMQRIIVGTLGLRRANLRACPEGALRLPSRLFP